jgi:flagellar assembly protein FliH
MSVKLIKAGEGQTANPFAPPSLARTNRPVQFAPPTVPPKQALGAAVTAALTPPDTAALNVTDPEFERAKQQFLNESQRQAEEALKTAQAEAQRIVADAQARAAEVERAARERGRAEAQAQAQVALDRAAAELRGQLAATLDELASLRVDLAARAEKDLVRLALAIAHKIVQREVRVDHEIALTLTRVALARVHSRAGAVVRLHPDDYSYVSAHRARLNSEAAIELVEDRNVSPGGCIVQSEMGEIDARIEQQFAEIEQDFLGG